MTLRAEVAVVWLAGITGVVAQEPAREAGQASIGVEQEQIARRYREFENTLNQTANLLKLSDPERSALLSKAFAKSKQELVVLQMEELSARLKQYNAIANEKEGASADALAAAVKEQAALIASMETLLELLLTEDVGQQLREQRERIEKYIGEVQKLKRIQEDIRGRTERPVDAKSADRDSKELAEMQGSLSRNAQQLEERVRRDDARLTSPRERSDGKPGDPSQQQNQSGEQGEKSDQNPAEDKQDKSEKEQTPGRKNLSEASKAMEQARKRLEELNRRRASEAQDQAIKELEATIRELEELLRQLREEERLQTLLSLEARFAEMLEMQRVVLEGTLQLDRTPKEKRTFAEEQKAIGLSRQEHTIGVEVDRAWLVLREDGTATAFPEAVEQIHEDVRLIESLLAKGETGPLTQSVEQDVIHTLEEMIEALQREIQQAKSNQNQTNNRSRNNRNSPSPLVDQLGELKLIRSLQKRVAERTEQLAKQYDGVNPPGAEIRQAVDDLAIRQARIQEVTRNIAIGKNQ